VYFNIRIYFLEIIKVNDFSKDYENLKNQIDGDKGKLIGFLFVGLIIGRIYEKLRFTKKRIFRRFK
jgi:hypothetical protein